MLLAGSAASSPSALGWQACQLVGLRINASGILNCIFLLFRLACSEANTNCEATVWVGLSSSRRRLSDAAIGELKARVGYVWLSVAGFLHLEALVPPSRSNGVGGFQRHGGIRGYVTHTRWKRLAGRWKVAGRRDATARRPHPNIGLGRHLLGAAYYNKARPLSRRRSGKDLSDLGRSKQPIHRSTKRRLFDATCLRVPFELRGALQDTLSF